MSRARLNINGRRLSALERRKEDEKKYLLKLKNLAENNNGDADYLTQILNKLKAAVKDIAALEGKVRK